MRRSSVNRKLSRKRQPKRRRVTILWPSARTRKRALRAFRAAPLPISITAGAALVVALWSASNWICQVVRKPTELYFPVSHVLAKMPAETWRDYAPIFRAHSTATISPELLAALAQVEAAGNPIARTYWRWSLTVNPFELYRPASSAVGMYQITNATFDKARQFCIHDHAVVEDGPWNAWHSCWFNSLYTRVIPSHAVELTAALLDREVAIVLARRRIAAATLEQKQNLAVMIHLCGASAGDAYARHGFRLAPGQRCGDHDASRYLQRVNAMKRVFTRLDTGSMRP
jgi:hypothetical protein